MGNIVELQGSHKTDFYCSFYSKKYSINNKHNILIINFKKSASGTKPLFEKYHHLLYLPLEHEIYTNFNLLCL